MGCGMGFLRVVLFTFNFLFWGLGGALVGIVAWFMVKNKDYKSLFGSTNIVIGLLVLGSFVFLIGFLGCCGAAKKNKKMLQAYVGIVTIIFIAEVVIAILVYVKRNDVNDALQTNWLKANNQTRDAFQHNFKCCGFNANVTAPTDNDSSCYVDYNTSGIKYTATCYTKLKDFITKHLIPIASVGISVAAMQIFGIIFSGCIIHDIKKGSEVKAY